MAHNILDYSTSEHEDQDLDSVYSDDHVELDHVHRYEPDSYIDGACWREGCGHTW